MAAKPILKKLNKAIDERKSQYVINELTSLVVETITEAAQEPLFYSLPFEHISNVVSKVEFGNEEEIRDPLKLLQTIIQKTNETHEHDAISLLNDIKIDNLPPLSIDDIIHLLSKFRKSELLIKLVELYEYDQRLLRVDYSQENIELKKEINRLKKELESAQQKTLQKFLPVTAKPIDFEENVFDACEKGKLDSVQYHFEVLHANKKTTCSRKLSNYGAFSGTTALHVAASYGHLPIVEYLCEIQNFNVETKTENGDTPLYVSCIGGHLDIVRYLCEIQKANAEAQNDDGLVPLHAACVFGHLSIVQFLCEVQKVNTEAQNNNGLVPLHTACQFGYLDIVRYLCEVQKVNTEAQNAEGFVPLHTACQYGQIAIVRYLCEVQKVNAERQNNYGYTPLHLACAYDSSVRDGNIPVVQYLCEVQKVNTNIKDNYGETPYVIAKTYIRTAIVKYLERIGVHK